MRVTARRVRSVLVTLVLAGLASLGIYAGQRALRATGPEFAPLTLRLEPRDFTIRISAAGEMQSTDSVAIGVPPAPIRSFRIAWVAPDGRYVEKGDLLVEFDPTELDLQVREQKSNLSASEQKISRGGLAVEGEKADIVKDRKIAQIELERLTEFLPRDPTLYSQRDIVEGALDKQYAERKIVFADARLELKGKVYTLDKAILLLEKEQATRKISQVETARASLKLLAPTSGIVVYNDPGFYFGTPLLTPGRSVWMGWTLLNLVKPETMEAKCFVLEKDAGELRVGQAVTFSLDPFPDSSFAGKVKSIDKVARPIDRGSPVKYFQAVVALEKTDVKRMRPGVKLKAQITATSLPKVLVVPRSAVVRKDDGWIAYVERGPGRYDPVRVALGSGDLIQVVVTSGLQAGERIALNPPDVALPGADSKAKKSKGVGL